MDKKLSKLNITNELFIEYKGNNNYICVLKKDKIFNYEDLKINEMKIHSIYENFNKIIYIWHIIK
jgi:hypothetical protein